MIYFDNSATTLQKPKSVAKAVAYGIEHFGNPSRSFNENALLAAREIYQTREKIANLVELDDPLKVAFTSGATESLNLVINSLFDKDDHVITTALDHNAVLRPLYNNECDISIVELVNDDIDYEKIKNLIKRNTKALVCTHASNVNGKVVDVKKLQDITEEHNLLLILDVSQTLGSIKVKASMADVLCFTGHKSLFGPQGTGGIITNKELDIKRIIKSGGAGSSSFAHSQSLLMPDIFEVGTPNSPGIYGLKKGLEFIEEIGLDKIEAHKKELVDHFINGLKKVEGIKIYGEYDGGECVGVVAINYRQIDSYQIAEQLYERYQIATRSQSHCAPLVHMAYNTKNQGMVRFSFSYFNTIAEIDIAIQGLKEIIEEIDREGEVNE